MKFGEKLKKLRLEKHLTQKELADMCNVGLNTISNYEIGKTYPQNREVYNKLADALCVNVDSLRNENEDFIYSAGVKYGRRGAKQAKELTEELTGLFAGGEFADEDLDELMRALQEAYWIAKDRNKKYSKNK